GSRASDETDRLTADLNRTRTELKPGTLLTREWDGHPQRVMVLADGFAWDGKTYPSLSKVAFAITGTRWSGPRFFGLAQSSSGLGPGRPGPPSRFAAPSTPASRPRPGLMSDDHSDNGRNRRQAADPSYLDQLAQKLAVAADLPLALAQRRVMALAISGRAR